MPELQSARPVHPPPRHRIVDQPADGTTRFPILAAGGTAVGTLLAFVLTPQNPEPKTALVTSAAAMAVGLAVAPVAAALRDPKSLLCGEHLLTLAPIYWLLLDLLQGAYELTGVSRSEARWSFIATGLFVIGVWASSLFPPVRTPGWIRTAAGIEIGVGTVFGLSLCAFALGIFKFAFPCNFNPMTMVEFLGQGRWDAPWSRGAMGGWEAFVDVLQYFGYLLPTMAVVLGRKEGWTSWRTCVVAVLALVQVVFLSQEGGRRIIGVVFGMAIIFWMLTERRLRARGLFVAASAVIGVLMFMQVMINYRNVGLGAVLQSNPDEEVQKYEYLHVDDNFYRLAQTISLIPAAHEHTRLQFFIFVIVRPVPRVLWPDKPLDAGFDLPAMLGLPGVSLSSSVVGELYAAGGMWVVAAGGLLYGFIARGASRLLSGELKLGALIIYCTTMMALFAGFRSMLDLVLISYVTLAWVGLCWIYQLLGADGGRVRTGRRAGVRSTP